MWRFALLAALSACQPKDSPIMDPGEECLSCHEAGAQADSRRWTIAGTVFSDPKALSSDGVQGAQVLVTDNVGRELTLTTNGAGNFYTAEPIVFPVQVSVQKGSTRIAMDGHPARGTCNSCHNQPPSDEAIGRIFIKGP